MALSHWFSDTMSAVPCKVSQMLKSFDDITHDYSSHIATHLPSFRRYVFCTLANGDFCSGVILTLFWFLGVSVRVLLYNFLSVFFQK